MRILIVDDSKATLEIIRRALDKFGYRNLAIRKSESVKEALKVIGEWQPAIVLTDWQMPNITGLSLVKEISKRKIAVRVAMITAFDDQEQLDEAMAAGANFVLTKPFSDQELHDKLLPVVQEVEQSQIIVESMTEVSGDLALPKLKQLQRAFERSISEDIVLKNTQMQVFDESKVPCLMAMYEDPGTQRVRSIALLDLYAICIYASASKKITSDELAIVMKTKEVNETILSTCEQVLSETALAFIDAKTKKNLRLKKANFISKEFSKLTTLYEIGPTKRIDFSCQLPDMALGAVTLVGF